VASLRRGVRLSTFEVQKKQASRNGATAQRKIEKKGKSAEEKTRKN
jgi:hypothetical protein